jgi:tRNA A-37 threonylcarbamoyl transferase component Bud32
LVDRLASGGMGLVWRAADEVLGRQVAVKLLRREYARDPAFLERFRAEARRTAALPHPGIASVFDYGEIEGPDLTAYLVMELVDGAPLSALIAREGRLGTERTLDVVAQAALALGSAHRVGVIHRDVKPGNLLVRRDGLVKVTDFGIARVTGEAAQTETGLVLGTAAYLSPEQVAGQPATPASDVYALGLVTYECLAGRRPFSGEHPIALALAHQRHRPPPLPPDVPEPVRALVESAMAKEPEARPASADALAQEALTTQAALLEARHDGAGTRPTAIHPTSNGWHGSNGGNGGAAREAGMEQGTGEWTPVSLVVRRAWRWSRGKGPVAVSTVLAMLTLLGIALMGAGGQRAVPTVVVPTVHGMTIAEARQALTRAGLGVRERARPDRSVAAGVVLTQDPAAGTRLARGGLVTLTVSSGPSTAGGTRPSGQGDGAATPSPSPAGSDAASAPQGNGSAPPGRQRAKKVVHDKGHGRGKHDER